MPVATEIHKEAHEAENIDCLVLDIKGLQTMKRFLNWGPTGSHYLIQASMLGCFCSYPQKPRSIPWYMVLLRRGQKGVDHSTTSLGVIKEGPTGCWQLYILTERKKKKTTPIIHHQVWQEKESPSKNGGCVSSNSTSKSRTTGNKHAHHIKRELFCLQW